MQPYWLLAMQLHDLMRDPLGIGQGGQPDLSVDPGIKLLQLSALPAAAAVKTYILSSNLTALLCQI